MEGNDLTVKRDWTGISLTQHMSAIALVNFYLDIVWIEKSRYISGYAVSVHVFSNIISSSYHAFSFRLLSVMGVVYLVKLTYYNLNVWERFVEITSTIDAWAQKQPLFLSFFFFFFFGSCAILLFFSLTVRDILNSFNIQQSNI